MRFGARFIIVSLLKGDFLDVEFIYKAPTWSLFLDPFVNKISDALLDLMSSKLRTLIPAQLSFEEDCARILHDLSLAACLLFSKEIESAIESGRKVSNLQDSILRQHIYVPEISKSCDFISDDELGERIKQFGVQVQNFIDGLVETDNLKKTLAKFPGFPCSGLVFASKKFGIFVREIFNVTSMKTNRKLEGCFC